MRSEPPLVSIIIISYNTREMTLRCLSTLYEASKGLEFDVWCVDNASRDGSAGAIRTQFPQVRLVENRHNAGFGAANNQAMERARGEYLLLLNSDAFLHEGALERLVEFLRTHPEVAVVGPKLLNGDGSLQHSCFRFPTPTRAWLENLWISALLHRHPSVGDYRQWPHDTERRVDFVSGACMLVRRAAFLEAGGFDEKFFMYSEETDWQRRMRARGWHVAFTPAAEVTHLGGASGHDERARVNSHFFDSLDYYEFKHHGTGGLISLRLAMTVGCFLRAILWSAVVALQPRRRDLGWSKVRLYLWLIFRQTTHWRLRVRTQ